MSSQGDRGIPNVPYGIWLNKGFPALPRKDETTIYQLRLSFCNDYVKN